MRRAIIVGIILYLLSIITLSWYHSGKQLEVVRKGLKEDAMFVDSLKNNLDYLQGVLQRKADRDSVRNLRFNKMVKKMEELR